MPHSVIPSVRKDLPIFVRCTSYFERKSTLPMARQSLALSNRNCDDAWEGDALRSRKREISHRQNVLRCQEDRGFLAIANELMMSS
jgi:hypothetical protein